MSIGKQISYLLKTLSSHRMVDKHKNLQICNKMSLNVFSISTFIHSIRKILERRVVETLSRYLDANVNTDNDVIKFIALHIIYCSNY